MSVALSEEILQIAEQVCRRAREHRKPAGTGYDEDSNLPAMTRPGEMVEEKPICQT